MCQPVIRRRDTKEIPRLPVGLPMIQSETPGVLIAETDACATLATGDSALLIFALMGVCDARGQWWLWGDACGRILPLERISGENETRIWVKK